MIQSINSGYAFCAVALAGFFCISLELFYIQLLNLKAWNHVVYAVISFAMLGSGIGANGVFVFNKFLGRYEKHDVISVSLLAAAVLSLISAFLLKDLPLDLEYISTLLVNFKSTSMILMAYTVFMLPFVAIGFLITYIFVNNPQHCHKLYFFDLAGAALGAVLFYFMIGNFAVFHSIGILVFVVFVVVSLQMQNRRKWLYLILVIFLFLIFFKMPEPLKYAVDSKKGWEWIPGNYQAEDYQHISSQWHSLGRTDIFRVTSKAAAYDMSHVQATGAFLVNLYPQPEFCYFTTNFLAGTPAYQFSAEGMLKSQAKLTLFSNFMETPYLLLTKPKVLVIGAGGARDIFMARTHEAIDILGAEVNSATWRAMSPGGILYDYSGRMYTGANTQILNMDGRHLVKTLKPASRDLIILNGVDTFSGLSSGAYTYAESYLYTEEAVENYLRVLNDGGILNVYRYSFLPELPREELRLFAIILAAVKKIDPVRPEDHIIVGYNGMSTVLVKKQPFTLQERELIFGYFNKNLVQMVYPVDERIKSNLVENAFVFNNYVNFFKRGLTRSVENAYAYDISVVTDDAPFFYKFYKFNSLNIFRPQIWHHTGNIVFLTQILIFIQAFLFICLFIFMPLLLSHLKFTNVHKKVYLPFILYVACLGVGFMFVEISTMQRFSLLLGSPIYSIGVVLTALLFSSAVGSLLMPQMEMDDKGLYKRLGMHTGLFLLYITLIVVFYPFLVEILIGFPFWVRILSVVAMVFPIGMLLGVFFPAILNILGRMNEHMIAWAWGINCGFSVLGSILAIIVAQFLGFNLVMAIAGFLYVVALFSIKRLLDD